MSKSIKVPDNFFTSNANTKPYLKIAFEGFAGTGKTYTAAQVAIGLHKQLGSEKPIVLVDTERAARFLQPLFEEAGIAVLLRTTRSFADLMVAMQFCRDGGSDVLFIDSISHFWEDVIESYRKRKNRSYLEFQDWGHIKPLWKEQFSAPFVNDEYSIFMLGRAGYEYSDEKDDRGKRQIYKSGVKMKVEGETAYEPDLLVLMDRFEEVLQDQSRTVWREAMVLKDRSHRLDGEVFKQPEYKHFKPAIDFILAGAQKRDEVKAGDTGKLFKNDEAKADTRRECAIELEEIKGDMTLAWPGQAKEDKAAKATALEAAFGTKSWTKVEGMDLMLLRQGRKQLRAHIWTVTSDERFEPEPDDAGDEPPWMEDKA